VVRRHYQIRLELTSQQRSLRLLVRSVCVADIVFALGILLTISGDDPTGLLSGKLDSRLLMFQGTGLLGALGALAVIYAVIRSWRERGLWFWATAWNFLVMVACLGFSWFAIHWNLMNFNMKY